MRESVPVPHEGAQRVRKRVARFAGVVPARGAAAEDALEAGTGDGASLLEWALDDTRPSAVAISGCPAHRLRVCLAGTIDNASDLARELRGRGHRFVATTETEVLAHAYEQWGEECVARLWGMFALAIWDGRSRSLVLARDRTGSKPVYYSELPHGLAFGSHLGVLRRIARVPSEVDPQAIDAYLTFETVPAPLTIFRAIRKLPAGHLLHFNGGALSVKAYWAVEFGTRERLDVPEAIDRFERLFHDVIGRLAGEGPRGLMLSGGIDSGITLASLVQASPAPVHTLTFAFPDDRESGQRATALGEYFGATSHVFLMHPRVRDDLTEIVARYEQPYANPSALTIQYVAHVLRDRPETVFTGEGADEVFAGRERHVGAAMVRRLQRLPGRRLVSAIGARLAAGRVRLFSEGLSLSPAQRHLLWVATFQNATKAELYSSEFTRLVDPLQIQSLVCPPTPTVTEPLDQMLSADLRVWIPENVWANLESSLSAVGIEIRAPFLDHRIVQFSASLPLALKVRWRTSKVLLRRAYAARIPIPPRRGRSPKISLASLLRGELRSVVRETLLSSQAMTRGYFRPAAVRQLVEEHLSGRVDRSRQVWTLFMLELWHRQWLAGGVPSGWGVRDPA